MVVEPTGSSELEGLEKAVESVDATVDEETIEVLAIADEEATGLF